MSVLSIIKRGREQAKEHNAKKTEKVKEESVKLPYKHVVSHAAIDALSGAPSSWKQADKPKIMEQNKRRTAMLANEPNMAGLPRVGSSLSYVSYASVHATPVVPLPKNYIHNNVPVPRRDQLAKIQAPDCFNPSGGARSIKGKEPEYLRSPPLAAPISRPSPGQSSITSSKGSDSIHKGTHNSPSNQTGPSLTESSESSIVFDDGLEIKNKTNNQHSPSLSHQSRLSQGSSSSSEKSSRTALASSRTTIETPIKTDRHYPPLAQSTYFSAPRPLNRRKPNAETPTPYISATTDPMGSTASSSGTSVNFPPTPCIAAIGVAIAPPLPPCPVAPRYIPPPTDNFVALERESSKTDIASISSAKSPRSLMGQDRASIDIKAVKPNGQMIAPPAPPEKRKRRRLSKSRPSYGGDSGAKMSIETIRPIRRSTTATAITTNECIQMNHITVSPTESMRETPKKLTKNLGTKSSLKGRWIFRFGSRAPAIAAR